VAVALERDFDEGLIERAAALGASLLERLEEIAGRHPNLVAGVRGMAAGPLIPLVPRLRELGEGPVAALVAAHLLHEHGILSLSRTSTATCCGSSPR
jgi:4-aminobutyrate aminotransferase-like enzyme